LKIALCLYGQPRFIDNPNIKLYLDSLIFDKYDVDTYCHFWYDDEITSYTGSDWHDRPSTYYKGGDFYKVENTLDIINKVYRPKEIIFEKPKEFYETFNSHELSILENKKRNDSGENYYSLRNVNNLLSHLYSIEKSLDLINLNNKYDFLVLTRYDSLILNFPDLSNLEKGYIYASNQHGMCGNIHCFTDNIFVIDTNLALGLKCFSNIKNIINTIDMWTAESVKKQNIIFNYNENIIKYTDLLVGVTRSNTDTRGQAN
jgi:hypothetical protein